MVVAIDGPAGAGKSTVARALARELGFGYLDTGAMYRCVGLLALRDPGADPGQLARSATIELTCGSAAGAAAGPPGDGEQEARVLLDGEDVSAAIRSPQVSLAASRVAADERVRAALVAAQREILARGDWVAEGRDIGTVVAPRAAVKVFLTADPAERARRRAAELRRDTAEVLTDQAARDERDSTRGAGPLRPAEDALALDTSALSVEQVVARIAALARAAAPAR